MEKRLTIKISPELHERLTKSAEDDLRSLSSQLIVLLTEALNARDQKVKPPSAAQQ